MTDFGTDSAEVLCYLLRCAHPSPTLTTLVITQPIKHTLVGVVGEVQLRSDMFETDTCTSPATPYPCITPVPLHPCTLCPALLFDGQVNLSSYHPV